jgi:hypothetical protein
LAAPSGRILVFLVVMVAGARTWAQAGVAAASIPAVDGAAPAAATQAQEPSVGPPQEESLPASIFGVVASKDGEVYEGVRVTLALTGADAPPPRTQATGSEGGFNFGDVPPGPFTLSVSSEGFLTQTLSGVLHAGEKFDAQTIVLPVSIATSEVRVSASQQDIALEQFHEEVEQRVLGMIPNYYVSYAPNAPPLTVRQKFTMAWKTSIDPVTWLGSAAFAGVEQARNSYSGYGQGAQGYAKRFGANYADGFLGTMIGGAVLPAAFKQDPRYFYKGTGTIRSRALYAIASAVICKGDNGRWQFDYSGIGGSLAAGALSNLYYPASSRDGVGLTFEGTLFGIGGSAVQNLFQEFVVRRFTPRLPHYGAPAQ